MQSYKCGICDKLFEVLIYKRPINALRSHIRAKHIDITWEEYKSIYNLRFDNIKEIDTSNKFQCQICGYVSQKCKHNKGQSKGIGTHIKQKHDISPQQYYNIYFKRNNCKWCDKETDFISVSRGYKEFCPDCLQQSKHPTQKLYWKRVKGIESDVEILKEMGNWRKYNHPLYLEYHLKTADIITATSNLLEYKQNHNNVLNFNSKNNYSKVSQELFVSIYNNLDPCIIDKRIYFATYDYKNKTIVSSETLNSSINYEYMVFCRTSEQWRRFGKSGTKLDFYIKDLNLLIEFDGTYWHQFIDDDTRDNILSEILPNIKILHIKEEDYKNNKQLEINKCLKFIKEIYHERIEN